MTREIQTKFGPSGDCLAASIASILELPISMIPDVSTEEKTWINTVNHFLKKRGYQLQVLTLHKDQTWFSVPYEYLALFIGQAAHDEKQVHAVVGLCKTDGSFQVEWNPANNGTAGISTVDMIGLFIPLDPAAFQFNGMPKIILPSDQERNRLKLN